MPKEELENYVGVEFEPSDWFEIDQKRINTFADATNDHQFIHIDPEQASKTPFGSTIAHGFLTLSMVSYLSTFSGIAPEGLAMTVNYGSDKVRFLTPVKVNDRIRTRTELLSVKSKREKEILVKNKITIDIENSPKPALIAEVLSLFILA